MKKTTTLLFGAALLATSVMTAQNVHLNRIGGYETGAFDEGAAEIISYSASNSYLYSVNSNDVTVDIISLVNPTTPSKVKSVDISTYGASANCVAVGSDYFVVAVEHPDSAQGIGSLEFFSLEGTHLHSVVAGALPDNVNISPDGNYVVAANEGEPNDDYNYDPEGSITIVDLSSGVQSITQNSVTQVSLTQFNGMSFTDGTIVTTNPGNSTVAQDLEPEYVTFNAASTEAYVVCQENNAIITVDLSNNNISINGLGFKEWANTNVGLDASNKASTVDFRKWEIFGAYMPDAMTTKNIGGVEYIFTANEGDGRDYDGFSAEPRVKDLDLNPAFFGDTALIKEDEELGRLKVIGGLGLNPVTGLYDSLVSFGGRSFSIIKASDKSLVYDSGSDIEEKVYAADPINFNSSNDETGFKDRSDDKGPEPEAIAVGKVNNDYYAFVGLERMGGVIVYNVTDVNNVKYVGYFNNRDFTADPTTSAAGDLAPECVLFIPKADNNHTTDLIVVANEVSGSISVYEVLDYGPNSTTNPEKANFSVYPNPASGFINVSVFDSYNIYDAAGKLVIAAKQTNQINVNQLNAGVYTIQGSNGVSSFVVK